MPSDNVEVVRRVLAAFNSGDIERILGLMDADIEVAVEPGLSAEPDVYRGHDGIRRYFDSFWDAMDEIRFHEDGFREADEAVVAAVRLAALGRVTRIPVQQSLGQVWTIREGKASRIRSYISYDDALKAAGLES